MSEKQFIDYARVEGRVFTLVRRNEDTLAFITVDEVLPGIGMVAYYGFKEVRGNISVDIGKAFLNHMLKYFNALIGITPITNKLAIRFNKVIGMKKLCIIPGSCYVAKDDSFVDGVLTQITRR
jgi:hypothetical protein